METKINERIDIKPDSEQKQFGISVSENVKNKIVRLFTYLEKTLALDDTIVRDFRKSVIQPSHWWLADYPKDLENLFIRDFETEKEIYITEQSGALLRVQKKNIESAPELP